MNPEANKNGLGRIADTLRLIPCSSSSSLPAGMWVIVPAYNEAARIGPVLDDLLRWTRNVVVVDDSSWDGTSAEALSRNDAVEHA